MHQRDIIQASKMIRESDSTIVLTGAGMSTESGIPDFRSPKKGLWEKIDPMEALSTKVLYQNPKKFYSLGYKILTNMKDAKPNDGHKALAEMEKLGHINWIATQNIDGLHQKSGSKNVLEVHGHVRTGSCLDCDNIVNLDVITEKINDEEIPPICNSCGGILRPDVVMFGDNLPEAFNHAWEKAQKCDLLIAIGSSLTVAPVNFLPQMAPKVIIINMGETAFDPYADLVIRDKIGKTLTNLLEHLKGA